MYAKEELYALDALHVIVTLCTTDRSVYLFKFPTVINLIALVGSLAVLKLMSQNNMSQLLENNGKAEVAAAAPPLTMRP